MFQKPVLPSSVSWLRTTAASHIAPSVISVAGFFTAATSRRRRPRRSLARRALTDERSLSVDSLLAKYATAIKAIRKSCPELLAGKDDIYVLRFAIEHSGDVAAAVKNVQRVFIWRRRKGRKIVEAAAAAVAEATAGGGWNNAPVLAAAPHSAIVSKYITGSQIIVVSTGEGDLCSCIRASAIDDERLMSEVSAEQMVEFFLYAREVNSIVADMRTRSTGRLVRLLAANDLTAVSKFPDDRFQKALTSSSEEATTLYPGLSGPTAILNIPEVVGLLVPLLTPLFPGAVQQRLKFARTPMNYLEDLTDVAKEPTKSAFLSDLGAVLKS